jgi:hypothetical protein
MRGRFLAVVTLHGCCFADCVITGATVEVLDGAGVTAASAEVRLLQDGAVVEAARCGEGEAFSTCASVVLPVDTTGTFELEADVDGAVIAGPIFTVLKEDLAGTCCAGFRESFTIDAR